MTDQPTPYQHPGRRSHVTIVPNPAQEPVTLSPLIDGMVSGTLGRVPLTSDVYAQLSTEDRCDKPVAWVRIDGTVEVLGLLEGRPVRTIRDAGNLPQLILTDGAR